MPKVDIANYKGREQAYIKHCLLQNYLSRWGYIIGSAWDSLVFVDGFAGPWGARDELYRDASFGIAFRVLNEVVDNLWSARQRAVRGLCVFVEKKPNAFAELDRFARAHSTDRVRAIALKGRFINNLTAINDEVAAVGANPFTFVFLDQKGWAATPIKMLRPFLRKRSCEVLFTLMTSFVTRFVDKEDRASSYKSLFGRKEVLDTIRALPKGTGQREEAAVREYCNSLRTICGFQYVSQAVILDPDKEKILYHLVFATNSLRGIEVFKDAESGAAEIQDEVRHQTRVDKTSQPGLPFGGGPPQSPKTVRLHDLYKRLARQRIIDVLTQSIKPFLPYSELYGEAMQLPLVKTADLDGWLKALEPNIRIQLEGLHRKKLSPFKDDRIFVINRPNLR